MVIRNTQFHVVPTGPEWQINRDGRPMVSHQHKERAVRQAVEHARATPPSQVIVYTADGAIEDEYTYHDESFRPQS